MWHPRPTGGGFALMSMNKPPAMGKCTLTKNYLVLPRQVLQPEDKGGVTPTENIGS